jgi:hypothetical protein
MAERRVENSHDVVPLSMFLSMPLKLLATTLFIRSLYSIVVPLLNSCFQGVMRHMAGLAGFLLFLLMTCTYESYVV